MRRLYFAALLLGGCSSEPQASGEPSLPPFPKREDAFVFRFRGVSPEIKASVQGHPNFELEELPGGVVQVAWKPAFGSDCEELDRRFGGKNHGALFHQFFAVPGRLGNTIYRQGGVGTNGWGGSAFREVTWWLNASIQFDDLSTGNFETMLIHGVIGPPPDEVQHDMLRYVAGTGTTVEKCGNGWVLVSRAMRGIIVAWPISEGAYVHLYNSYDKEMVAAYVHRLGSVLPQDFKVDVNKWILDEISYRTSKIDRLVRKYGFDGELLDGAWRDLNSNFPDIQRKKGMLTREMTPEAYYEALLWVRHWLWANRDNFKYYDVSRGYILKGPDRFDPQHPPELPEEMRRLPKPPQNEP